MSGLVILLNEEHKFVSKNNTHLSSNIAILTDWQYIDIDEITTIWSYVIVDGNEICPALDLPLIIKISDIVLSIDENYDMQISTIS